MVTFYFDWHAQETGESENGNRLGSRSVREFDAKEDDWKPRARLMLAAEFLVEYVGLASTSLAPLKPHADADRRWQAHVADGRDVLVVGQVLDLPIDTQQRRDLVTRTCIELCVPKIEITVGQQQTVAAALGRSRPGRSSRRCGWQMPPREPRSACGPSRSPMTNPVCGGRRKGRAPLSGE